MAAGLEASMGTAASRADSTADGGEGPAIHQLLHACSAAFSHGAASPRERAAATGHLAEVLARTRAADVGLAPDTDVREIEYIEIADWPQYTVGIFLVPKGRKLPLHDHPGMTVLSKVLFGKMAITSFDKVDYGRDVQESDYHTPIETIVRSVLKDFTSDDGCNILHSTSGGNLHEFLAIDDVAILDVLAPPYDFESGRPCTYFRVVGVGEEPGAAAREARWRAGGDSEDDSAGWPHVDIADLSVGQAVWMVARKAPADFYTQRRPYSGPALECSLTNILP